MASNLPPGVTTSMIPGNRPEDLKEEAFWEAFFEKAREQYVPFPEELGENPNFWLDKLITIARDLAYTEGINDGREDAQMDMMAQECIRCGYAHSVQEHCHCGKCNMSHSPNQACMVD